ncbi:MAG TPA: hypothetical protein VKB78_16205, partial [Pirellulales bacterium]|nr:hypothetical protein [Pirellulales bacterium]
MIQSALEIERVALSGQQLHRGHPFPLVLECETPEVGLEMIETWLAGQRARLIDESERSGAVLFRGFPLKTAE